MNIVQDSLNQIIKKLNQELDINYINGFVNELENAVKIQCHLTIKNQNYYSIIHLQ